MVIDLHTHSVASDGCHEPEEVVRFAVEAGVTHFSLTDHDTVAAVPRAREACRAAGIVFYPGCELSVTWYDITVHVVALDVRDFAPLEEHAARLSVLREERARVIAGKLDALGFHGTFETACAKAGHMLNISRRHFAMALIAMGVVETEDEAFRRFLGENRPAFVPGNWQNLAETMRLIEDAGALAVLAHPGRYHSRTSRTIDDLLAEFKSLGGRAIEVTTGSHTEDENRLFAQKARHMRFYASTGSDFHGGRPGRPMPGRQSPLPENLANVLELLEAKG